MQVLILAAWLMGWEGWLVCAESHGNLDLSGGLGEAQPKFELSFEEIMEISAAELSELLGIGKVEAWRIRQAAFSLHNPVTMQHLNQNSTHIPHPEPVLRGLRVGWPESNIMYQGSARAQAGDKGIEIPGQEEAKSGQESREQTEAEYPGPSRKPDEHGGGCEWERKWGRWRTWARVRNFNVAKVATPHRKLWPEGKWVSVEHEGGATSGAGRVLSGIKVVILNLEWRTDRREAMQELLASLHLEHASFPPTTAGKDVDIDLLVADGRVSPKGVVALGQTFGTSAMEAYIAHALDWLFQVRPECAPSLLTSPAPGARVEDCSA